MRKSFQPHGWHWSPREDGVLLRDRDGGEAEPGCDGEDCHLGGGALQNHADSLLWDATGNEVAASRRVLRSSQPFLRNSLGFLHPLQGRS